MTAENVYINIKTKIRELEALITGPDMVEKDFEDDEAAALGGVPFGGLYHTAGVIKINITEDV